jgi:cholesterol transport system auxiliary component
VISSRFIAVALVSLGLGGCIGPKPSAAPAVYDLGSAAASEASALPARAPLVLVLSAAPNLNDSGIVWRIGDSSQPRSYATVRWAAAPAQLISQRLSERLSREGPVLGDSPDGDVAQLRISVTQFEQVFAPDGASSEGRIGMQAVLLARRQVLGQVRISQRVSAASQDAEGGVAALRQATGEAADALAQWLASRMPPARP